VAALVIAFVVGMISGDAVENGINFDRFSALTCKPIGFPIDPDIKALVQGLTLQEKVGQMMQMDISTILQNSQEGLELNQSVSFRAHPVFY